MTDKTERKKIQTFKFQEGLNCISIECINHQKAKKARGTYATFQKKIGLTYWV